MQKLFLLFLACLLFSNHLVFAEIKEVQQFEQLEQCLESNPLIFLNITDTIYASATTLGLKQWRNFLRERIAKLIKDNPDDITDRLEGLIVKSSPKRLVDESAPRVIHKIQKEGILIQGISKKRKKTPYCNIFADLVADNLLGFDIDFSISSIEKVNDEFASVFYRGILFTEKKSYAEVLKSLYLASPSTLQHILLMDNNLENLKEVEAFTQRYGIQLLGLHFRRTEHKSDCFDAVVGIIQFFALVDNGFILTDEEAQRIRKKSDEYYLQALDEWIRQNVHQ